ncbi:hypothetical protein KDC22_31825 [Paenibacillus tritici]|uniref:hypothetical protein n=1 Tax=Paenibacillus tritici TaxID=1873425 RepID=UPI001BA51DF9|nr:hypothetical protein [Paenibacillus tritici]QUL54781.1 hypothetical protein KDC22_31825 [Paenibacillus tritici]
MYIPISRINAASLTRSPHQADRNMGGSSVLSFPEMMAAVAASIEDQARRIKRKYGLSVRILAVSKDGSKGNSAAASGVREDRAEIVIAPNILQQMSKDPVLQRKIYGELDAYVRDPHTMSSHSLIVHRDGTCALLPAATGPEAVRELPNLPTGRLDMEGSSYAQDRLQQLAFIRARRSGRQR